MVPAPGVVFSILSFVHRVFTPTQFRCGRPRRSGSLRAPPQLAWGSMRIDVSKMALQPFVQKRPAGCDKKKSVGSGNLYGSQGRKGLGQMTWGKPAPPFLKNSCRTDGDY